MLFTLLVGIADFARLYFTYTSLSNAAREGTRFGLWIPITQRHLGTAERLMVVFGEDPDIQISFPDGSRVMGARIRVRTSCLFSLLVVPIPRSRWLQIPLCSSRTYHKLHTSHPTSHSLGGKTCSAE